MHILVNPDQLRSLSTQLQRVADDLRAVENRVGGALGGLDWEVRQKAGIEEQVGHARNQARALAAHAEDMARYLERKAQAFEEADGEGAAGWPRVPPPDFWLWPPIPGPGLPGLPGWLPPILPILPILPLPIRIIDIIEIIWPPKISLPSWFPLPKPGPRPTPVPTPVPAPTPSPSPAPSPPPSPSPTKVIEDLDVTRNRRYRPGEGKTYCNIFAMDYAKHMGAPLPECLKQGDNIDYLDANEAIRWLRGDYQGLTGAPTGPQLGWRKIDAKQAAEYASKGYVVIAGWQNTKGPGHMAVVRPESKPGNIRVAQAGAENFENGSLKDAFGDNEPIEFFVYIPEDNTYRQKLADLIGDKAGPCLDLHKLE